MKEDHIRFKFKDIPVHVFEDGTETFELSDDYKNVYPEDENEFLGCPFCNSSEVFFKESTGKYVCLECEGVFTEDDLEEHCGTGVWVED